MIKVNLLEGTAEQRVTMQRTKVAARRGQQIFMLVAALAIFVIAFAVDHYWTNHDHENAQAELRAEQEEQKRLEADIQRKNDIEAEIKQVDERIKIIKELKANQKGPVTMLSAINERMPGASNDFTLQSVTQKAGHIQIVGSVANQQVLYEFSKQLEVSGGLFNNVTFTNVEGREDTDKKTAEGEQKLHRFHFTLDCDYNKPKEPGTEEAKPANPAPQPGK